MFILLPILTLERFGHIHIILAGLQSITSKRNKIRTFAFGHRPVVSSQKPDLVGSCLACWFTLLETSDLTSFILDRVAILRCLPTTTFLPSMFRDIPTKMSIRKLCNVS